MLKPAAPQPPSITKAHLDDLRAVALELSKDYREAYQTCYLPTRGDTVLVHHSVSDPTGNIATEPRKMAIRRALVEAARREARAYADLDTALRILVRAMEALDPPDVPSALQTRTRITRVEYALSVQAQERRTERGDGYGDT